MNAKAAIAAGIVAVILILAFVSLSGSDNGTPESDDSKETSSPDAFAMPVSAGNGTVDWLRDSEGGIVYESGVVTFQARADEGYIVHQWTDERNRILSTTELLTLPVEEVSSHGTITVDFKEVAYRNEVRTFDWNMPVFDSTGVSSYTSEQATVLMSESEYISYVNSDVPRSAAGGARAPVALLSDDAAVSTIASYLDGKTEGMSQMQKAYVAMCFVQDAISYKIDLDNYGASEYWATPYETLWKGYGDCEDTATLLVSIALLMKLDAGFVAFDYSGMGHMSVAIAMDSGASATGAATFSIVYDDTLITYIYAETADSGGRVPLGHLMSPYLIQNGKWTRCSYEDGKFSSLATEEISKIAASYNSYAVYGDDGYHGTQGGYTVYGDASEEPEVMTLTVGEEFEYEPEIDADSVVSFSGSAMEWLTFEDGVLRGVPTEEGEYEIIITISCIVGEIGHDTTQVIIIDVEGIIIDYSASAAYTAYFYVGYFDSSFNVVIDNSLGTVSQSSASFTTSTGYYTYTTSNNAIKLYSKTYSGGDLLASVSVTPSTGYTCSGFSAYPSATGLASQITSDTSFYFIMSQATYKHTATLQYNANNGSGAPSSQTNTITNTSSTASGSYSFTVSSTVPTRSGYTFLGWSTSSSASSATYSAGDTIPVNYGSSKTLYAVWSLNKSYYYAYLYYSTSGTASNMPSTQSASIYASSASGSKTFTISSNTPTRSGYEFNYWTYGGSTYSPGGTISVSYGSSKTLTANWSPTYTYTATLTYDANGGSGAPGSDSASYTTTSTSASGTASFTISSTVPAYSGYKFLGWADSSSATSAAYGSGGGISVSYGSTKTIYAIWTKNLTLSYNGNDTSATNLPSSQTGTSSTTTASTFTTTISTTVPSLSNHDFLGWATSSGGTAQYKANQPITITADTTLYATWQVSSVTLTFHPQNGSTDITVTLKRGSVPQTPATQPELYGYAFGGWYTDMSCTTSIDITSPVYSDTSYYAKWTGILAFTTEPVADGTCASAAPGTYSFSAAGSENASKIEWDFGDGSTATGMYVSHWYGDDGLHTVTLTVYGSDGSSDTQSIIVGSDIAETTHEGGGGIGYA